jgi:hypothetical protein
MEERTLTKGEQKRVDACQKVVEWASENKKHRGCIVIATDEKSSTCAVIGESQGLISALLSAIKSTPNFRNILSTVLMLDMVTGGSKSDTDKDK